MSLRKLLQHRRCLTLVCWAILQSSSIAVAASVASRGQILDATTRQPISMAVIVNLATLDSVVSDSNGRFELTMSTKPSDSIEIRADGYENVRLSIGPLGHRDEELALFLQPKTVWLEGITITASRFPERSLVDPHSVIALDRSSIANGVKTTTSDAVAEAPGIVLQKTTYGHGSPIIRGLLGTYVNVLYDGIRLNKSTYRFGPNQYLNLTEMSGIDRIEVQKGPSSVMYGSDAMGGTINLMPLTTFGDNSALRITPNYSAEFSTADEGRHLMASAGVGTDRMAFSVAGSYRHVGDLKPGGGVGRQSPTGWSEYGMNTSFAAALASGRSLRFSYLGQLQQDVPRYDKYRDGSNQQYVYDPQDRHLIAATYSHNTPNSTLKSLELTTAFQAEKEGRTEQKRNSSSITMSEDKLTNWSLNLKLSSIPTKRHWLVGGFEASADLVRSQRARLVGNAEEQLRPTFPDRSRYYSSGLFAQDRWQILQRLLLSGGVRLSWFRVLAPLEEPFGDFRQTYASVATDLGSTFFLSQRTTVYANWSRGFRAPNLDDIAVLETTNSGMDAPNTSLKPEQGNFLELGVKHESARLFGSVAAYYSLLRDLIERRLGMYAGRDYWDEDDNGFRDSGEVAIYQKQNVARARIYGAELQLQYFPSEQVKLMADGQWTWGEDQIRGEPLSRIPPITARLRCRYSVRSSTWIEGSIRAATSQRRVSARDRSDTRIGPNGTGGWTVFGLALGRDLGRFNILMSMENISDKLYKMHGSGIDSPGRNFTVQLFCGAAN